MGLRIAGLEDEALWALLARAGGLPSHRHGHAAALAQAGIVPRLAGIATPEGGAVLPFFARRWPDGAGGAVDVCSWLSVTGARLWGDPRPALALWRAHARAQGWVASYLQVEPFSLPPAAVRPAALTPGPEVLVLDLAAPPAGRARSLVRALRRAEAAGCRPEDDPERLVAAFCALYPAAMRRRGAGPAYGLAGAALRALATAPDTLCVGAVLEGQVQAVAVIPVAGDRAEGFLTADTQAGRPLAAWLYAHAIDRLRARGVRWFDLGGGVTGRDGVYAFKARFGATPHRLGALRMIHDPARYAALCRGAGVLAEIPPGPGRFPAYRTA